MLSKNKLLALAGSFSLSNGLLLLAAPRRFANLRRAAWLPDRANRTLDQLGRQSSTGRGIGAAAALLGLLLLALALRQTPPRP